MLLTPVHWQGCYRDGWQDLIVPDAFAHPAKYARGLIHRIYRHLIEQGYVRAGETVLDPFGGVALGALDAMTYGLHYIGVELESRFIALGQQNLDLWRQRYGFTGGTLVQGDSRRLRQVLGAAQAGCCVGSPPFAGCDNWRGESKLEFESTRQAARGRNPAGAGHLASCSDYGTTTGQLGAMPPGQAGCVVGSPPFCQSDNRGDRASFDRLQAAVVRDGNGHGGKLGPSIGQDYGTTPGQLGAMPPGQAGCVVGSPPYAEAISNGRSGIDKTKGIDPRQPDSQGVRRLEELAEGYGTTPGQLGAMPPGQAGCVVGSPLYAGSLDHAPGNRQWSGSRPGNLDQGAYGTSPAQLGNTDGDTFWTASAQIMTELAALLPHDAVCAWVVKAYVKDKQIVPFPDQWRALCEAHGFTLVEEIHASLVEEHGTQEDFFEGAQRVQTSRKSFFRRLCERKGSPRIDHETVLILARQ